MILSTLSASIGLLMLAAWFVGTILFFDKVFPRIWDFAMDAEKLIKDSEKKPRD
jgi:hypothetical protein